MTEPLKGAISTSDMASLCGDWDTTAPGTDRFDDMVFDEIVFEV